MLFPLWCTVSVAAPAWLRLIPGPQWLRLRLWPHVQVVTEHSSLLPPPSHLISSPRYKLITQM